MLKHAFIYTAIQCTVGLWCFPSASAEPQRNVTLARLLICFPIHLHALQHSGFSLLQAFDQCTGLCCSRVGSNILDSATSYTHVHNVASAVKTSVVLHVLRDFQVWLFRTLRHWDSTCKNQNQLVRHQVRFAFNQLKNSTLQIK